MEAHHAVVWIDHKDAHLFRFTSDDVEKVDLHAHKHQYKNLNREHGSLPEDTKFLRQVVDALQGAERVLVVGPSRGKLQLLRFMHEHSPEMEHRVVGVETVDHPTDNQLVAYARAYFKHSDRMTG